MKINLGCLTQWIFSMNNKKTRNVISSSKHESNVARYMKEVRDMEAAGITRRDLFKMGLTSGVGGLVAIGGASFIPNLAQAAKTTGLVISPVCKKPWSEPLVIPAALQSVASFVGPQAGEFPTKETIYRYQPAVVNSVKWNILLMRVRNLFNVGMNSMVQMRLCMSLNVANLTGIFIPMKSIQILIAKLGVIRI
jgi:hypothetical protein